MNDVENLNKVSINNQKTREKIKNVVENFERGQHVRV